MRENSEKLVALVSFVFMLATAACVPSCATKAATAEKTAVTALALTVPAIESARRAAYENGLKAESDIKKLPALAAAEALRAQAMKALIRQLRLSEGALEGSSPEARKVMLWALADALTDLLEAFSTGPLPKVPLPPAVLLGLKTLRGLAGPAVAPAPAGDAAPAPAPAPAARDSGVKSDG